MKKTSYFEMLQASREWIKKNGATEANIEHLRKILPEAWSAEIISDILGKNDLSF